MIELAFPDFWPERLAWLIALATLLTGFSGMIMPRGMMKAVGLAGSVDVPNGVSEFRSSVGGAMCGVGLACLLMAQPFTYFALGLMFFFACVGRVVSFVADGTFNKHCLFFLLIEALGAYFPLQFVYFAFFAG
jgi:hypothetical protein